MIKIASFNVNSIKARLPRFISWLNSSKPDVVCLQELKCQENDFPFEAIQDLGYNAAVFGQKTFNGVAILSKFPIEDVVKGLPKFDEQISPEFASQARYIEAVISLKKTALRVASIYVPNGGGELRTCSKSSNCDERLASFSPLPLLNVCPNTSALRFSKNSLSISSQRNFEQVLKNEEQLESSAKFQFKLQFFEALKNHCKNLLTLNEIQVFGGDFNVACNNVDIYDPKGFDGQVLFHPLERQGMRRLLNLGMLDSYRLIHPQSQAYSWWDYRGNSWNLGKGARIDYLLLSPLAADLLSSAEIEDKGVRDQEKASDHCPAVIELRLP